MNARAETIAERWSFRKAWALRQFCVIPAVAFYEPYYERPDSKAVRWKVERADNQLFGIAGIWDAWRDDDNNDFLSFAMITINCDRHPLLNKFHRWFDENGQPEEKRTVVLLSESEAKLWMDSSLEDVSSFFRTLDSTNFAPHLLQLSEQKHPEKYWQGLKDAAEVTVRCRSKIG